MSGNISSKGSRFKYYLPSFLFFTGSTFVGVFATLIVVLYPVSMFIFSLLPIIGFFLIAYLYISFEDLRVTQQIKVGELTDKTIQDLNTFYTFWKILFYIFSVILLFIVPAYLLVNRPIINSINAKISNNTLAFTENDTIIINMFSEVSDIKELKLLYSDSLINPLDKMTLLDYSVINNHPYYTFKIPNKKVKEGVKHFYIIDNNNKIIGTSNALDIRHSYLTNPQFKLVKRIKNDLLIKYENQCFESCSTVVFTCKNLDKDYTVIFNRPLLFLDSITIPIHNNDIYLIELIIIDSLNNKIRVDTTFTLTNHK